MKPSYTTFEIAKALGIPRERIQDWIKRGFVEPTEPARGQGTKALFTLADIYGVILFERLIRRGFRRDVASRYAKEFVGLWKLKGFRFIIWKEGEKGLSEPEILTTGQWMIHVNSGRIADYDPKSQRAKIRRASSGDGWFYMHVINLEKLRKDVDSALAGLG